MTRSIARIAREIQSCSNKRDLARLQQDRDQILFTIHSGTGKGTAAAERYAARAAMLASLEETMWGLVTEMREALADLTTRQVTGENQGVPSTKRKKRTAE